MHGDAAFAGQGVVAETLNLSQLRGYRTGGTIHVVVNNQVGFTTSPGSSRSSLYCTDVARMVQAPIFHVNGDDPEACIRVARLAFEYRQAFKKDVVIDLVCYRRRGHNEGDDPSYTQPLMYDLIEQKRSVRKLYTESLIGRGDITIEEAEQVLKRLPAAARAGLHRGPRGQPAALGVDHRARTTPTSRPARPAPRSRREILKRISDAYVTPPDGLHRAPEGDAAAAAPGRRDHRGPDRLGHRRDPGVRLAADGRPAGAAGRPGLPARHVRAAVRDDHRPRSTPTSGRRWPTSPRTRRKFYVYDSLLSEYAALGFEYGYSVARPEALVLWEAQFGDFVNGAQTIIDEFITSSETKWRQQSGVVLLLPHGYEGQGPDHSSARIERFMTMCADDAFVVAQPSTPGVATSTCCAGTRSARSTAR